MILEQVTERLATWLSEQGMPRDGFSFTLVVDPRSPWVRVTADAVHPFVVGEHPEKFEFAIWEETGAVHTVLDEEVQDPEIFRVAP